MARKKKVKKNCGIYMILNLVNNKKYIGQSINIKDRWSRHKRDLKYKHHGMKFINGEWTGKTDHLQRSWNFYGKENFEFHILKLCRPEDLSRLEKIYVWDHQSFNPNSGYNETPGGEGYNLSDEIKRKIKENHWSTKPEEEQKIIRKKMSDADKGNKNALGHKVSNELKKHFSQTSKGNKNALGNKHTEEAKESMSKKRIEIRKNMTEDQKKENDKKIIEAYRKWRFNILKKLLWNEPIRRIIDFNFTEWEEKRKQNKSKHISDAVRKQWENEDFRNKHLIRGRKYQYLLPEWRDLRNQGLSYREIGEKYNLKRTIISNYLNKFYPEEKTKFLKYRHFQGEWTELRKQGLSYHAIGQKYNVSSEIVKNYLTEYFPMGETRTIKKYDHLLDSWRYMRKQGLSYDKIAERHNTNSTTVKNYLVNYYPEESK
jgi:group I intron endonuclease